IRRLLNNHPVEPAGSAVENVFAAGARSHLEVVHHAGDLHDRPGVVSGAGQGSGRVRIEMPGGWINLSSPGDITAGIELEVSPHAAGRIVSSATVYKIDVEPEPRMQRAFQMAGNRRRPGRG